MLFFKSPHFKYAVYLGVILTIFLVLGLNVSLKRPLTAGRDEVGHFQFIRFIAKHHHLPTTWDERDEADYKSDWPPLFHLFAGFAGSNIDLDSPPFIKIAQKDARNQLVIGIENIDYGWLRRAITTEDPYQGEVLLWYLGRWIVLACGLVGIVVVYLIVRACEPGYPWLALGAAALLAFVPNYIIVSGLLGYDPLLGTILAFFLLFLFYTVQRPNRNWIYFVLGLLIGLASLTKQTPWPVVLLVPGLIIWFRFQERWTWGAAFRRLGLFGLAFALTFGSWAAYQIYYFNQVEEYGLAGLLFPFFAGSFAVTDEISLRLASVLSGGSIGGGMRERGGATIFDWTWMFLKDNWKQPWLVWTFLVLFVGALLGVLRRWRQVDRKMRLWLTLLLAYVGLVMLLPLLRFMFTGQADLNTAAGQHILFPLGAAVAVLVVLGWRAWLKAKYLTILLFAVAGIYLAQDVVLAYQYYNIEPWPIRTVAFENESQLAGFPGVSLIGYEQAADDQSLQVTLQWRAEDFLTEDYRVELTLLDEQNQPQARWLGQPINGFYPTRAWHPEDRVRDEILLSVAGLSSGEYAVQLRLLGEAGPLAPVMTAEEIQTTPAGDGLSLDLVSLTPSPLAVSDTLIVVDQKVGYALWNAPDASGGELPKYSERGTVTVVTDDNLDNELTFFLVGPDEQAHPATDQIGNTYSFALQPNFARGDYRLKMQKQGETGTAETPPLLQVITFDRQFEVGPIFHPLEVNFADRIGLLGYDLPQRRVQAGEGLLVTMYWQSLKTMAADFNMFNHLIGEDKQAWGGRDRRPREVYSTLFWVPDEIVTDPFVLEIDPNAPDGIYYVLTGFYLPVGSSSVYLPVMENGQMTDVTNISIGPVKIGNTPPGLTVESVDPEMPLNQPFGDTSNLTLLGYDVTDEAGRPFSTLAAPPASLKLTLYWRAVSPLMIDYTTFVHLRDGEGNIVAQKDGPPLDGAYPTGLWDPGEMIADEIILPLPTDLSAGKYQLVIGLYDFYTGQRLTVPDHPANEVELFDVELP